MSNVSNAPYSPETAPKKDHTAAIVITVVLIVVILPLIFVALIMFGVFHLVSSTIDKIDIDDIIGRFEFSDGITMTHNEAVSARSLISQLESAASRPEGSPVQTVTISRKDCMYLQRIASYSDDNWFIDANGVPFCENSSVYAGVDYEVPEPEVSKESYADLVNTYRLYLSDAISCAVYGFDGSISLTNSYKLTNRACDVKMFEVIIVDTGETLEPIDEHNRNLQKHEDGDGYFDSKDDSEININIKA